MITKVNKKIPVYNYSSISEISEYITKLHGRHKSKFTYAISLNIGIVKYNIYRDIFGFISHHISNKI